MRTVDNVSGASEHAMSFETEDIRRRAQSGSYIEQCVVVIGEETCPRYPATTACASFDWRSFKSSSLSLETRAMRCLMRNPCACLQMPIETISLSAQHCAYGVTLVSIGAPATRTEPSFGRPETVSNCARHASR